MLHKPLSLESSLGKAQVQRVLSLTWGTRLVRGQGSVHSSHSLYSLGQSSPPRPWGQWVPGGTPGGPQLCSGRNRPGHPHSSIGRCSWGWGIPGSLHLCHPSPRPFMRSGPHSASSAQLFLFPAVFSRQPLCVCGRGGGGGGRERDNQRSGRGDGSGRGASVPLKGQAAPDPVQASLPSAGRPSRNAQCESHKSHQTPLCF